ncbi:CbtB domain-containing protein [Glaciimonas immobilis]|uniref:Cobalt transporter subunit CbtB n=1 Tax=Glaciimonas immobilis TaxID=728004 RepID=A0A840RSA9_9BURK|nr:CbtB domain-containing protein [Glaciimonas immobilis]KAF3997048.1 CbtB-domain containing protein [Glaciimonas immobilis]MBB5199898.1 cobalt transporter subunit CbtB [Glaciimonas immobilis]
MPISSPLSSDLIDHTTITAPTATWKARVMPALLSAVVGLVLVYMMGFSHSSALHNAAHDGRHSAGFPCH